mgnify:CR=1 FL=1
MSEKKSTKIRKIAFWPAFILLFGSLVYSIVDKTGFYAMASAANTWVLDNLGWTYSLTSFLCLVAIVIAYFSPLGNVTLGGKMRSRFCLKQAGQPLPYVPLWPQELCSGVL